jgi:hypothetical protein
VATAEERLEILKMIQSGQITADEGARLLEILKEKGRPAEGPKPPSRDMGTRLFRIQVTDLGTGRQKVNMTMPWSLVSVGVNMGARFARKEIDASLTVDEFTEAIRAGVEGRIVDMVDEEKQERVEIFVE